MIKTPIKQTALTTTRSNEYFAHKIEAPLMNGDASMAATCRALFHHRLKDKETINVTLQTHVIREDFKFENLKAEAAGLKDGQLIVHSILNPSKAATDWRQMVTTDMTDAGLYRMDDLEKWLDSNKIKTVIYTNRPHDEKVPKSPVDNTATIVFIESLNMGRWHTLQFLLKRFLSKWFVEIPLTQEEQDNLVMPLVKDDEARYQEYINKVASTLDFRSGFIRKKLEGFEKRFEKDRVKQLESEQKRHEQKLEELSRQIGDILRMRDDTIAMLHGYEMGAGDAEPYVMNYFLGNKNLVLKDCTADRLDFFVSSWFTNWDPGVAKNTFAKDHMSSWLNHNESFGIPTADAKMLYKAIFIDETVKVRLWSSYRLALRGDNPVSVNSDTKPDEIMNALPNPHHMYNHCLGNNSRHVAEAMRVRDIIGAIEQCISATKGINLMESVSYRHFTKDLFDPQFGAVCFVKDANKFMTTKDAIEYLKGGAKHE